ncbi:DUF2958 domain-containing protein [Dyadobacter sp. CY347]
MLYLVAPIVLFEIDPFYEDIAFDLCDLGMGEPELGKSHSLSWKKFATRH